MTVGRDVELRFGWVYYQKKAEPCNIMYRSKWYVIDDLAAFRQDNYFIKSYPWEYEKEFRLVFINRTGKEYDYLYVEIPADIRAGIKVRLAPELREAQFRKFTGLHCIGTSHLPAYSGLGIRMNLFTRNRVGLLDYLREEIAHDNPEIDPDSICTLFHNAGKCRKD